VKAKKTERKNNIIKKNQTHRTEKLVARGFWSDVAQRRRYVGLLRERGGNTQMCNCVGKPSPSQKKKKMIISLLTERV
jgi:hypothetical protein